MFGLDLITLQIMNKQAWLQRKSKLYCSSQQISGKTQGVPVVFGCQQFTYHRCPKVRNSSFCYIAKSDESGETCRKVSLQESSEML